MSHSVSRKKHHRRWLWIVSALIVLAGGIVVLDEMEDVADVRQASAPPPVPLVSVIHVEPGPVRAEITAFAEVRPRWQIEMRAAVSGRVTHVHDAALAGARVIQGTPFLIIEKAPYVTEVAEADRQLAEAELALVRAKNQVTVARKQFARDGVKPPNDLAIHLPDLRIAEKAVVSATAQLDAARIQLRDTDVVAPFSGIVTERMVSLGQSVSEGDPLLNLADDRHYELVVELPRHEWALLEQPIAGTDVGIFDNSGNKLGEASIRQGGGFLNPTTRQTRLFLDVTDPDENLLAGDFVQVRLSGRSVAHTLTLPETSVTRTGQFWVVDGEGLLRRIEAEPLFRVGSKLVIAAPFDGAVQVVLTPLTSFFPGQPVAPKRLGG